MKPNSSHEALSFVHIPAATVTAPPELLAHAVMPPHFLRHTLVSARLPVFATPTVKMSTFHLNSAGFILDLKMKDPAPETIPDCRSSYTDHSNDHGVEEISGSSFRTNPFENPYPSTSARELLPYPHIHHAPPPPRLTFGDPTPIAVGGFLLANTPATIMLLGWGDAGGGNGDESAAVGLFFYLGAPLLYFGGIGEWIRGETFSSTIYFTLGGYFGASGATLVPFHNASGGYGVDEKATDVYHDSYAGFLIFMGLLMVVFMIGSLRVDVVHVAIFAAFALCFPCLAAAYFVGGNGRAGAGYTWRIIGAWMSLIGSALCWYLFLTSVLESVNFPVDLPVGDLSRWIKGKSETKKAERHVTRISISGRV